ncbi:hypothetical protein ACFQZS_14190 [Mucilaginibacter calamicampi]|uniref:BIG2 domain-containing protein n=1 Tax=Mucilaginibacter calamicampi TaxID=1302352 RepID=A0ABW2YYZ2_9SPHI
MKKLRRLAFVTLCAVTVLVSCKKVAVPPATPTVPTETSPVTSTDKTFTVTVKVAGQLDQIGKTTQAVAEVKDAKGVIITGKTVTWSLSALGLISISPTGLVTALQSGATKVIATVENVTAEATVTVGGKENALAKSLGCLCDEQDFAGKPPVVLTAPIMKPEDISILFPLGYMWKGHVTPIDHQYYYPLNVLAVPVQEYPVYAPADGYVIRVSRTGNFQVEAGLAPRDNYDILIQHSCNTYTLLTLVTGITAEMSAAIGQLERGTGKSTYIKITAGQQIARVGGQSLDVTFFDTNTPEKKWVVPAHYQEQSKKYATDPFMFYTPGIKNALLAKTLRTTEPKGGRFDYDEDGKLAGTWFLQGTNGYEGAANQGNDYWRGHLVFAYHAFDPSAVEISIGRWNKPGATEEQVKAGWQFSVKGNTPDPKNVMESSGLVKYELANITYSLGNGNPWDMQTYQGFVYIGAGNTEGVLLVQMIAPRLIRVEAFPGKTAGQVTGFTTAAQLYER